ncbi:DUF1566 domain-containing protein [bacterium]|nr:DUF1566 domain-containing protein [bacterium]
MHWSDAVDYCKTLNQENYGGFNDWHLPKIKVLRTLVQNCNSSDGCEGNSDGLYSTLGDIAFLWSSTGGSSEANGIYFYNGTTQSKSVDESFDARCVRRATTSRNVNCSPLYIENTVYNSVSNIPQDYDWEKSEWFPRFTTHYDYEASTTQCRFKCPGNNCKKDLQTGLIWSEKAEEQKNHSDASDYCSTLKENGVQGWDLPNIAKLQTLFPLCFGYEECKYNSLGDKDIYLWTSNNITPNTHTYYYYVYSNGNTDYADPNEKYDVRCARCEVNYFWDSASHKCTPFPESECSSTSATPCRDSSNGLTWSEKPSYTMVLKAAEDYCSGLNSSNYGGYSSGWRLPTIDELRTLLIADRVKNNCQVSGINDCLSSSCWSCGNCTESCTSDDGGATCSDCTYYDDGRYSKFGDTGSFWSYSLIYPIYYSADVWIVDFGSGYVDFRYNESESSVRCVREGGAPCNKNYFWNGSECVNPCDENPCDGKEHTVSGSCSAISMETFTCKCNSNSFWNGSECVNPCDPNPCNHTGSTGVCTATSDTKFTCGCEDSYFFDSDSGKCLNPCDPNPCNHTGSTGTCNAKSATEFSCRCEDNYLFDSDSGKCLNPCDPNPCNHTGSTGTCSTTSATKFTCGCKDNYFFDSNSGKCLNPCDSNPCDSLTALTDKTCVAYNFKRYSCAGRDPETNLTWSSIASSDKKWSGAVSYCDNLNESGYTDWRLPTISELRTLIQNCPGTVTGGSCGVVDTGNPSTSCLASSCKTSETCRCDFDNRDGRYSKFGDNNVFWSSSTLSDDTDEAWMLYFSYGEPENVTKTYQYVKVRCVR